MYNESIWIIYSLLYVYIIYARPAITSHSKPWSWHFQRASRSRMPMPDVTVWPLWKIRSCTTQACCFLLLFPIPSPATLFSFFSSCPFSPWVLRHLLSVISSLMHSPLPSAVGGYFVSVALTLGTCRWSYFAQASDLHVSWTGLFKPGQAWGPTTSIINIITMINVNMASDLKSCGADWVD